MITTYSFTNNDFSFSKGVVLALEKCIIKFLFLGHSSRHRTGVLRIETLVLYMGPKQICKWNMSHFFT